MKRWLSLGIVVALLIAALTLAQRRKPHADVSPDAVLHFIGDTEREISRLPLSATRLSDADEIRIGDELAGRYKSMEGLRDNETDSSENKDFRRYISQVGAQVAGRAQRKLPYKFHYVPDRNMVNAFALPGGHVFIGQGLLDLMDSEDELAAVLGHEVEHIDRRHAVERLQIEARLRHLGLASLLVAIPLELFQAGYSKEQELEADREGTRLAVMSGYSPTGAVRMFEAFDRRYREVKEEQSKSPQEEVARVVLTTMEDYFRSHPPSRERALQIQNLMAQEGWTAHQERPLEIAYLLWTGRAQLTLNHQKFKEAAGLATQALRNKSDYEPALRIKADAEFYQAEFRLASDTYRELLRVHPEDNNYVQLFAFMLASANAQTAATNFQQWMTTSSNTSSDVQLTLAALQLLNHNSSAADQIISELRTHSGDTQTPERLAWLAWWYYVSGNPQRSFELLDDATQQRPNTVAYLVNFAWTAIDMHRYDQALTTLQKARNQVTTTSSYVSIEYASQLSEVSMATAVAQWLAQDKDQALGSYSFACDYLSSWTNPAWYRPQYSPTVSTAIAEMKSELERRKKKSAEKH